MKEYGLGRRVRFSEVRMIDFLNRKRDSIHLFLEDGVVNRKKPTYEFKVEDNRFYMILLYNRRKPLIMQEFKVDGSFGERMARAIDCFDIYGLDYDFGYEF